MSWSPNTLGICRSIGRPRCCAPRASTSSARSWRSGSAMRPRNSSRSICGCASSSWPRPRSRSMRRWRRCSIPAVAAPRRATSGRSRAMTGRGAGPTRRPSPTRYAPGRGAIHALKLLEGYRGIVQCDGYAAYKTIADAAHAGEAITLAFCWAHLRRQLLRYRQGRHRADRQRGARTHRRALCDREDDPRPQRRGAPRRPPGTQTKPLVVGAQGVARAAASRGLGQGTIAERSATP